jgi:hypothetical protein
MTSVDFDALRAKRTASVMAVMQKLAGAESKHPLTDRDLIRVKAQVALRQAAKSGLLT